MNGGLLSHDVFHIVIVLHMHIAFHFIVQCRKMWLQARTEAKL